MHRLITSPVTTKLPITFAIIILSFRRIPCHRQITIIYMETEKIPPRDTTGLVEQSQYPPKKTTNRIPIQSENPKPSIHDTAPRTFRTRQRTHTLENEGSVNEDATPPTNIFTIFTIFATGKR